MKLSPSRWSHSSMVTPSEDLHTDQFDSKTSHCLILSFMHSQTERTNSTNLCNVTPGVQRSLLDAVPVKNGTWEATDQANNGLNTHEFILSCKYGDGPSGADLVTLETSETSVFMLYHNLGCGFYPQGWLMIQHGWQRPGHHIWAAGWSRRKETCHL